MDNTAKLLSDIEPGIESGIESNIEKLNAIGIALSVEQDVAALTEHIVLGAKDLTGADGGTLYLIDQQQNLQFEIVRNDSLGLTVGGTSGEKALFNAIPLYLDKHQPNNAMVVAYCVHHCETINVADAYQTDMFDFSGTREFDRQSGYRSTSFLTIPMKNHDNAIIGVLQLINKQTAPGGDVIPFTRQDQHLAESLASQAAVAITQKRLMDELKELFNAFVKLIASAIDKKSPYTGAHCRRVPVLTMMLADAAHNTKQGPLADFTLSEQERYSLEVASWLHDCGKVTSPEYIVDKATKLETIFDRIELVNTRFEVLKRDAEIRKLRQLCHAHQAGTITPFVEAKLDNQYLQELNRLHEEREFIQECNIGGEFMDEEKQQNVRDIAKQQWQDPDGDTMPFLSHEEVYNLTIPKGTLTPEERDVVQHHIVATHEMLDALPFPPHLKNVPEYAGGHHERMDGKGYPRGLTREQMSVPARTMAIADVFEALTAKDRPYKEAKKLSEALNILGVMKQTGHLDPDLFDVFINQRVYLEYAKNHLIPLQIDITEPHQIPGYPFD